MENILKVLQEPTETMYKGLSQRAQNELSPQEVSISYRVKENLVLKRCAFLIELKRT